ncbi:hypothetical protein G7077_09320 [Sphingomonas piscis]|uniref:Uncharacterized protein n=1 Tax=Sphingomonas piscis TaxID=2714943 RepID=A0A6G7YQP2_9SPHN|nr:hypothetical protein [Sphingomonas piscis]QIK79061.1 hypothetical protein G7077_09320 [Sphingomonas piscis]
MATLPMQQWAEPATPLRNALRMPKLVASTPATETIAPAALLSDLEWSIVDMARLDSLASLRAPTRLRKIIYAIFGLKPANQLANERLEALRRVAVQAWRYRWNIGKEVLRGFFDAGYSQDQYELIQRRIAKARSARNRSKTK